MMNNRRIFINALIFRFSRCEEQQETRKRRMKAGAAKPYLPPKQANLKVG